VCVCERERERMLCDLCLGVEVVKDHTSEVVAMPLQLSYMGVTANHMLAGIMDASIQSRFS
jgi:hypothetical protein